MKYDLTIDCTDATISARRYSIEATLNDVELSFLNDINADDILYNFNNHDELLEGIDTQLLKDYCIDNEIVTKDDFE